MGVVLEAWDNKLQRFVAIKAMHPHLAANGTARQRFVRETRGSGGRSSNVVAIHTVHADHDPPYFVMPLICGESLQTRLDRTGPIDVESCLRIAILIADGRLQHMPRVWFHRDIKPANIFSNTVANGPATDFGVVRVLDEATMTAGSVIAGTPEYNVSEHASGQSSIPVPICSVWLRIVRNAIRRSPFRSDTALGRCREFNEIIPDPFPNSS